jgi:hypothetical protein
MFEMHVLVIIFSLYDLILTGYTYNMLIKKNTCMEKHVQTIYNLYLTYFSFDNMYHDPSHQVLNAEGTFSN